MRGWTFRHILLVVCFAGTYPCSAEEPPEKHSLFWRVYQSTIGNADGDRCPMSPGCSAYAEQAVRKHGPALGWIMTFDRFIHETTEAKRCAHGIRYRDGEPKAIDDLEHNDFWWAAGLVDEEDAVHPARTAAISTNRSRFAQGLLEAAELEELERLASALFAVGDNESSAAVWLLLFERTQRPEYAFRAAAMYMTAAKHDIAAPIFQQVVDTQDVPGPTKAAAFMGKGICYEHRGLHHAAASVYRLALNIEEAGEARDVIHAHLFRCLLRADRWGEATMVLNEIDTQSAARIRDELQTPLPHRSPLLAGTLSAVVPGSGQVYCRRYKEGLWAFVVCGAFAFASYEAFDHDLEWVGAATTLTGLSWYSGNIYGATSAAHKYNRRARDERISNWIERIGVTQGNGQLKVMLKFEF